MTKRAQVRDADCCGEFDGSRLSRRALLKGAAVTGSTLAAAQMFGDAMLQASFGGIRGGSTMVVISLRGGIDGLGVVVPHGDPGYYKARPNTAVPANLLLCRDSMFGLHPAMAPLEFLWNSGELAAVQATGLAVPNRSHFSAIEGWKTRLPGLPFGPVGSIG